MSANRCIVFDKVTGRKREAGQSTAQPFSACITMASSPFHCNHGAFSITRRWKPVVETFGHTVCVVGLNCGAGKWGSSPGTCVKTPGMVVCTYNPSAGRQGEARLSSLVGEF